MQAPAIPADESVRIAALRTLGILDTLAEERFDRITRLATHMFNVPIALFSIVDVDRQWFKSRQGLAAEETPREISFCGHAILGTDVFVVEDASLDDRFRDNPLVEGAPNIRFYAGAPVGSGSHSAFGTICLISDKPRTFSAHEQQLLGDLAAMVEAEISSLNLSSTDELTGLVNRRGFLLMADQALRLARRHDQSVSILFADLDGFKKINDELGHPEGDVALKRFSAVLVETMRESDIASRFGGDEFVSFLPDVDNEQAVLAIRRLEDAVDNESSSRVPRLAASVGSVTLDASAQDVTIQELLQMADEAMYLRKQQRRKFS